MDIVPLDQLLVLASRAPDPAPRDQGQREAFDVAAFVRRHFVHAIAREGPWQGGGYRWILTECPFNPDHRDRSAVIIQMPSGAAVFRCHHNGCMGQDWRALRERFEPKPIRGGVSPETPTRETVDPIDISTNGHHPPTRPAAPFPFTDAGNGERYLARHGENHRYCDEWGRDYLWDGWRFQRDLTRGVYLQALETVRAIPEEAGPDADEGYLEALMKFAKTCESNVRIEGMLTAARPHPPIAVRKEDFDRDPFLFNCMNGTIDLRTGALLPHRRGDLITKLSPVEYGPDAECPRFLDALERWTEGEEAVMDFLQKGIGYSMTGDVSEQVFFILYGPGGNGKSEFINAIRHPMGDYQAATRAETFLVKNRADIPNDVAALVGARWVTAVELEEDARLAEAHLKQMTGGDRLSARFLHKEFFDFDPVLKLWFVANHRPQIRGADNGMWRRVRLIPFPAIITEEERDYHLGKKLRAEAPGILRWMVEGCLRWRREGLNAPSQVLAATEDYRTEMDTLGQFIRECCTLRHEAVSTASRLYEVYSKWCESNGIRPWSKIRFGRALSERPGLESDRDTTVLRQRIWQGIEVRMDALDVLDG